MGPLDSRDGKEKPFSLRIHQAVSILLNHSHYYLISPDVTASIQVSQDGCSPVKHLENHAATTRGSALQRLVYNHTVLSSAHTTLA